jgi:hypothetical protein
LAVAASVLVAVSAGAQVTISLQSADLAAIPGSVRSLYADVEGSPNLKVNWTVTGGCTLASPTTAAVPQIVTAPAQGGVCKFKTTAPTNEDPSFSSATSCTVTATSAADPAQKASIVIPVCAPAVTLTTFPGSTVLYKNQYGIVQSDLRGSVETGVTWAITTNPGGAGALTGGAANRHAVFSAKAAGTYVLTATSVADHAKTASTVIHVTQNDLPAPNGDHTEAVDCTAVGSGKTYEVGPGRDHKDLNAVSWNSLKRGDTVRIHNDDTTGSAPTTYHQHVSLTSGGTEAEPVRICGVPDAKGVKPIIEGEDATSRGDADWARGYVEGLGLFVLYDSFRKWDSKADEAQNIVIEGLHFRDANVATNYVKQGSSAKVPFDSHTACIRVQTGRQIMIRGNDLENCNQGVFTNGQTPEGSIIDDVTVEGNYLHGWGAAKNYLVHGMYLQAIGLQVQFNYFGPSAPGAIGNAIKSRSVLQFLRWNFISQPDPATARAFDMVEPQAFTCYVTPFAFAFVYHGGGTKSDCNPPRGGAGADRFTADAVAANFEAYHSDYIYGNIMDDGGSNSQFVHYGYDQQTAEGPGRYRRGGTLYYWNNTHLYRKADGIKQMFDAAMPDKGHSYEYPTIQSVNNVFAVSNGGSLQWTRFFWTQITVDSNWIAPTHILPNRNTQDHYQGGLSDKELGTCDPYNMCKPGDGHMIWARGGKVGTQAATLYVGPTPFDMETFLPSGKLRGLGAPLPAAVRDQPSNMEYFPATNTIAPRKDAAVLGALD